MIVLNYNYNINKHFEYKYLKLYSFNMSRKCNILNEYSKNNVKLPPGYLYISYISPTHPQIHKKQIDTILKTLIGMYSS